MNFEIFIAKRLHFGEEKGREVSPPAIRVAKAGIALGLVVMLLSVAIVIGFKKQIRDKVIGFGSHIQITNFDSNTSYETVPIAVSDSLVTSLLHFSGIKQVRKFSTKPGIIKTSSDFLGVVLKGVEEDYDWSFFKKYLKEGFLPHYLRGKISNEVLVSKQVADVLGFHAGDSFLIYFIGESVRARKLKITGIYDTGFADYDKLFVPADIRQINKLNGWNKDEVSGLELIVDDFNQVDFVTQQLYYYLANRHDRKGNTYYAKSIKDLNPMIFNWLNVLDINVIIILVLMLAVSGFTMISGLLIIILERANMIGILKTLGQTDSSLRLVFLNVAFFLVGKGMMWGNIIGLSFCFIQSYFHVISLDPSVYYINAVPIGLTFGSWLLINVGTLVICMLMLLAPSYLIAHIEPAKTVRFE
ncbi:MAG: ABC transporter permease [Massilibacteroides sp.]|nr:ABC transporter permease [Massilibacteroides sp.]